MQHISQTINNFKLGGIPVEPSFIKLLRSDETNELMKNPNCFMLLIQIGIRARRTDSFNVYQLKPGEALIGDYESIGLTQSKYRTAKKKLEEWEFVTFRTTNKGTVAKLMNTSIIDINIVENNNQNSNQISTRSQPDNICMTTNNKDKKEKNDNKDNNCIEDVILKFKILGIQERVAKRLFNLNNVDYLRMKISEFEYLKENHPDRVSQNPQGYLIKSISDQYESPSGFDEWYDLRKKNLDNFDKAVL